MKYASIVILLALASSLIFAQNRKDRIIVEFSRDFIEKNKNSNAGLMPKKNNSNIIEINHEQFNNLNKKYAVGNMKRVFTYNPTFNERHKKYNLDLYYEIEIEDGNSIQSALKEYGDVDIVKSIEHFVMPTAFTDAPGDEKFSSQWGLYNSRNTGVDVNVLEAWDYNVGDPRVVVAIIDNCFDYAHEDLKDNLWTNINEIPNGIDDDNNGYTDDVMGWNFRDGNPDVLYQFQRDQHGTHVGGIVAARTANGIGVAGIAGGWDQDPGISMMVFRCGYTDQSSGNEYIGWGYEALVYAADNGAAIAQCSWGGNGSSQAAQTAVQYFTENGGGEAMTGGLVIAAAGNANTSQKHYPSAYPEVLSVGSISSDGARSVFSNYGEWVKICAPGSEIMSSTPMDMYDNLSGTSMACPMVSGVAALVLSAVMDAIPIEDKNPQWLSNLLIENANKSLESYSLVGGLVNAGASVKYALDQVSTKDKLPQHNVGVFPNPTTDYITINSDFPSFAYQVYNLLGVKVEEGNASANQVTINTSQWKNGAYVIAISNNNNKVIRTFIKK